MLKYIYMHLSWWKFHSKARTVHDIMDGTSTANDCL
jgi:hypothetical protein